MTVGALRTTDDGDVHGNCWLGVQEAIAALDAEVQRLTDENQTLRAQVERVNALADQSAAQFDTTSKTICVKHCESAMRPDTVQCDMAPRDNVVVRLSAEGRAAAQAVADERFEGNMSQAIRYLLGLGLAAHHGSGAQ